MSIDILKRRLANQVAIVTGGASGIGAETTRLLCSYGARVAIADLPSTRTSAEKIIQSVTGAEAKSRSCIFVPTDIRRWAEVSAMFNETKNVLGIPNFVVANAGIMESKSVLDMSDVDEDGEVKEPVEAYRVIDVNLKGTLNTLKLALHHINQNQQRPEDHSRGTVVLVASTSGYFGSTGVTAYVASKHGVIGLLRASQTIADSVDVRVNAVAPFFTPTHITSSFSADWEKVGLQTNTQRDIANEIVNMLTDSSQRGSCSIIAGGKVRELEHSQLETLESWVGFEMAQLFRKAKKFFADLQGYPLPKPRKDVVSALER